MGSTSSLAGRAVLVTGATGFLGSHLVAALAAAGARVHAVARGSDRTTRIGVAPAAWHRADMTDFAALARAMAAARPDVVFHLAAAGTTYDQQDADRIVRVNIDGAWNLWRALGDHACRVVMAGTCGEYGQVKGLIREDIACRPTWLYPASVHAAVTLMTTLGRQNGREVVVLRPFGPYGPADNGDRIIPRVFDALVAGREVRVTAGEQLRDFAYVDDHVAGFLLAATRPLRATGEIYNIGSGVSRRLREVIETAARLAGGDAVGRLRFGAVPYRPTEVWEMCADITAARRDLGFEPAVSLEDGLSRTLAWYRQHRSAAAGAGAR